VESAGEIAPEEDPTTSYRGAEDKQELAREQSNGADSPVTDATTATEPDVPEAGRASSGDAEGVPGGGSLRPGEERAVSEGAGEEVPAGEGSVEQPQDVPSAEAASDEADENNE
jgi:hypothetical protein